MSFPLKSTENRLQKPPTTTGSSSVPRRTVCLGPTGTNAHSTHKAIPKPIRRSVPNTSSSSTTNKTPDLLRAPKFGGQQMINRKPDITKNLPVKTLEKKMLHVVEKPK